VLSARHIHQRNLQADMVQNDSADAATVHSLSDSPLCTRMHNTYSANDSLVATRPLVSASR